MVSLGGVIAWAISLLVVNQVTLRLTTPTYHQTITAAPSPSPSPSPPPNFTLYPLLDNLATLLSTHTTCLTTTTTLLSDLSPSLLHQISLSLNATRWSLTGLYLHPPTTTGWTVPPAIHLAITSSSDAVKSVAAAVDAVQNVTTTQAASRPHHSAAAGVVNWLRHMYMYHNRSAYGGYLNVETEYLVRQLLPGAVQMATGNGTHDDLVVAVGKLQMELRGLLGEMEVLGMGAEQWVAGAGRAGAVAGWLGRVKRVWEAVAVWCGRVNGTFDGKVEELGVVNGRLKRARGEVRRAVEVAGEVVAGCDVRQEWNGLVGDMVRKLIERKEEEEEYGRAWGVKKDVFTLDFRLDPRGKEVLEAGRRSVEKLLEPRDWKGMGARRYFDSRPEDGVKRE